MLGDVAGRRPARGLERRPAPARHGQLGVWRVRHRRRGDGDERWPGRQLGHRDGDVPCAHRPGPERLRGDAADGRPARKKRATPTNAEKVVRSTDQSQGTPSNGPPPRLPPPGSEGPDEPPDGPPRSMGPGPRTMAMGGCEAVGSASYGARVRFVVGSGVSSVGCAVALGFVEEVFGFAVGLAVGLAVALGFGLRLGRRLGCGLRRRLRGRGWRDDDRAGGDTRERDRLGAGAGTAGGGEAVAVRPDRELALDGEGHAAVPVRTRRGHRDRPDAGDVDHHAGRRAVAGVDVVDAEREGRRRGAAARRCRPARELELVRRAAAVGRVRRRRADR